MFFLKRSTKTNQPINKAKVGSEITLKQNFTTQKFMKPALSENKNVKEKILLISNPNKVNIFEANIPQRPDERNSFLSSKDLALFAILSRYVSDI